MVLKFIHFSDTHLSRNYPPVSNMERVRAYNEAFNQVIETAIKEKVNFILHTGDLFDRHRPFPRTVQFVNQRLLQLFEKGIPLILIRGNHDGSYIGYGAYSGAACDYVTSIMTPSCEIFDISQETPPSPLLIDPELYNRHDILAVKGICWGDELMIKGCGYAGHNSQNYIRKWVLDDRDSWDKPTFLLFHDYIPGITSFPGGYSGITVDELARCPNLRYVGIGHEHLFHEMIKNNVTFVCPGSTEAFDFSEANCEHYFIFGTFDGDKIEYEKRPIEPFHYIRYEIIESKTPQSCQWYKEQIQEKIDSFHAHTTSKKKIIKIAPKGPLKSGESLYDLEIPKLEEKIAQDSVVFSTIDISNIIPHELIVTLAEGEKFLATPRLVFEKLDLIEDDKEKALEVFDFMQQQLDDDSNLTRSDNLKKPAEDQVRSKIVESWEMEEA